MRDPKKKCIAKKCEDCNFYQSWDMKNQEGLRKSVLKCSMQVMFEEIPYLRGSIDGCQSASNETRNAVQKFGADAVKALTFAFENTALDHTPQKKIEE